MVNRDKENVNDALYIDAQRKVKAYFGFENIDDMESGIDNTITILNAMGNTQRYSKWKKLDYKPKILKLAEKVEKLNN